MTKKSARPWRITGAAITKMARQIAERFQPDKIILFGSYAYGKPHIDSDVDVLVVMPAKNVHAQAVRIRAAVDHPFPLDLLVRTPDFVRQRLELDDQFMKAIVSLGKVLYEKSDRGMDA